MKPTPRVIAILSFIVSIIWMVVERGFKPLLAILAGVATLLILFAIDKSKDGIETLDRCNRRIMLALKVFSKKEFHYD